MIHKGYNPKLQRFLVSETLMKVPKEILPPAMKRPIEVWLSGRFLVQVFAPQDGGQRLTINCPHLKDGGWVDHLGWDELMKAKSEAGFGGHWAVEIYPPEDRVVNVANMRHLWVLPEAPSFAWKRD